MKLFIQKPIQFLLGICKLLGRLSLYLACLLTGLLVLLVFAGSVSRYLVGVPLAFADETASLLFLSGTVLTLTYGYFQGSLIRISLIWENLPPGPKKIADIVGHLVAAAGFVIIAKSAFDYAWDSYTFGAKTTLTNIPLWPWAMTIPFSLCLLSLTMFLSAIDQALDFSTDSEMRLNQ